MTGFEAFIYEELDAKHSGGDEVRADCIECGKEKHMYINIRTGLAYCFACGYSANVIKLLMDVRGITYHDARDVAGAILRSIQRIVDKDSRAHIASWEAEDLVHQILGTLYLADVKEDRDPAEVQLPKEAHSISPGDNHADYLRERGIKSARTIRRHGLMYALLGTCTHIIFPDYSENGVLCYYTTRNEWWDRVENSRAKSLHPKGITKPYLFGECFLKMRENLILVEGPMDALALSGYACPLLGKFLSKDSAAYIANKFKRVVLALDADAQDDAMKAAEFLTLAGVPDVRVYDIRPHRFGNWGLFNDPADLYQHAKITHDAFALHVFRSAKRINFSDRVRAALP